MPHGFIARATRFEDPHKTRKKITRNKGQWNNGYGRLGGVRTTKARRLASEDPVEWLLVRARTLNNNYCYYA